MFRLFIRNSLLVICFLGMSYIFSFWIRFGWVNSFTNGAQLIGFSLLAVACVYDLRERPSYDPVKRFFLRLWGEM